MVLQRLLILFAVFAASKGIFLPNLGGSGNDPQRNHGIRYFLYKHNLVGNFTSQDTAIAEFDPDLSTIVIIHGHRGFYRDQFSKVVQEAASRLDVNVFVMDWSQLARDPYSQVVHSIQTAAQDLRQFVNVLLNIKTEAVQVTTTESDETGGDPINGRQESIVNNDDVHLVGFDIGAHLAGNAGYQMQGREPLGRVTGLDPTGKSFGSNSLRLSRHSAQYVEVIHTDGGLLGEGIGTAIGHVDFFVNGGSNQPGCLTSFCNHDRSFHLFAASLEENVDHIGRECYTMTQMTLNTCRGNTLKLGGASVIKDGQPGIYRVNTGRFYPFTR